MADSTVGSLYNPTSVTIGSVSVTGVQSISWSVPRQIIQAPAADAETFGGTPKLGSCAAVTGTITFSNQYTADAVGGLSGSLSASAAALGGQAAKTLTITNCQFGEPNATLSKDAPGTASIQFMAGSEDGTTNPVSYS